jgi:site-specific DNA-methyltransferase (adenine-specific)
METVSKIEMRKINEVKPYVRNPRKNDKTVELLCEIIPKVGFNQPILIDKQGVIVKGHARYTAAIRLGMTEVPCVVTEADEEAIRLDRIADNKISEFSEWNQEELMHELDSLNIDFDLTELGLPNLDFDMPTFDDFEDDNAMSEAERQAKYQAFLEKTEVKPVQIVSQKEIDRAVQHQTEIPSKPARYYKVVCEKCGQIMFIKEGDLNFELREGE